MSDRVALLVIDLQNDFMPGGALAVQHGDQVVPLANRLMHAFRHAGAPVVLTQDWHPPGHVSFASAHAGSASGSAPGPAPFTSVDLAYGPQVLWPDHCVQGSMGAAWHPALDADCAQAVIRKGHHAHCDSYSAFVEADRRTATGLAGYLREIGVDAVVCCGLATDFCVAWSALDARTAGFTTWVVEDACRAIDLDGSLAQAWSRMEAAGVGRIDSAALPAALAEHGLALAL